MRKLNLQHILCALFLLAAASGCMRPDAIAFHGVSDVDFVLTFEEVGALFSAKGINVAECEEAPLGTASGEGRGYAVSGGVAAAVKKLVGDRFEVKPLYINGLSLKGIRQLQQYAAGDCPGNLVEVMTCEGGCVGGAGVMAPARKAARAVENFSKKGKV